MQAPGLGGPGLPPAMAGQMTPEALLGMPGNMAPPGLFQEMMGEELPPEELLRRQGGRPPGPPIR
jgi:hypothetical protein